MAKIGDIFTKVKSQPGFKHLDKIVITAGPYWLEYMDLLGQRYMLHEFILHRDYIRDDD